MIKRLIYIFILIFFQLNIVYAQYPVNDTLKIGDKLLKDFTCEEFDSLDNDVFNKKMELREKYNITTINGSGHCGIAEYDSLADLSSAIYRFKRYDYCNLNKDRTDTLLHKLQTAEYWEDFTEEELQYLSNAIRYKRDSIEGINRDDIVYKRDESMKYGWTYGNELYDSLQNISYEINKGLKFYQFRREPVDKIDSLEQEFYKAKRGEKPKGVYYIECDTVVDFTKYKDAISIVLYDRRYFVPKEISYAEDLVFLYFTICKPSFDPEIPGFKNLALVDFGLWGELDSLPDFVYKSNSLISIFAIVKNEESISDNIQNLTNLESLYIYISKGRNIPTSIYKNKSIKTLDICQNLSRKSLHFTKEIQQMDNLEILYTDVDLSKDNNLEIFAGMKNLKTLTVDNYSSDNLEPLKQLSFLQELTIWDISDEKLKLIQEILPNTKCYN